MSDVAPLLTDGRSGALASVDRRDAVARHFLNRGHGLEFEMEARWIRSQLPPQCNQVADVGCGNGALFQWLGTDSVVGFDFAPDGLQHTRERFSEVPLVAGCAEHLPAAASSFDAIVMQHVVEHLVDVDRAARGWHRVLRVGGRLIIVTPNADFVDPSVYDDPTHTHIFTRTELRDVLEGAGFDVCNLCTLGLPFFRSHDQLPGGWRLRRGLISSARLLSRVPGLAGAGQSLCCVARRMS
jgi:SAM-dependent methyltransferase